MDKSYPQKQIQKIKTEPKDLYNMRPPQSHIQKQTQQLNSVSPASENRARSPKQSRIFKYKRQQDLSLQKDSKSQQGSNISITHGYSNYSQNPLDRVLMSNAIDSKVNYTQENMANNYSIGHRFNNQPNIINNNGNMSGNNSRLSYNEKIQTFSNTYPSNINLQRTGENKNAPTVKFNYQNPVQTVQDLNNKIQIANNNLHMLNSSHSQIKTTQTIKIQNVSNKQGSISNLNKDNRYQSASVSPVNNIGANLLALNPQLRANTNININTNTNGNGNGNISTNTKQAIPTFGLITDYNSLAPVKNIQNKQINQTKNDAASQPVSTIYVHKEIKPYIFHTKNIAYVNSQEYKKQNNLYHHPQQKSTQMSPMIPYFKKEQSTDNFINDLDLNRKNSVKLASTGPTNTNFQNIQKKLEHFINQTNNQMNITQGSNINSNPSIHSQIPVETIISHNQPTYSNQATHNINNNQQTSDKPQQFYKNSLPASSVPTVPQAPVFVPIMQQNNYYPIYNRGNQSLVSQIKPITPERQNNQKIFKISSPVFTGIPNDIITHNSPRMISSSYVVTPRIIEPVQPMQYGNIQAPSYASRNTYIEPYNSQKVYEYYQHRALSPYQYSEIRNSLPSLTPATQNIKRSPQNLSHITQTKQSKIGNSNISNQDFFKKQFYEIVDFNPRFKSEQSNRQIRNNVPKFQPNLMSALSNHISGYTKKNDEYQRNMQQSNTPQFGIKNKNTQKNSYFYNQQPINFTSNFINNSYANKSTNNRGNNYVNNDANFYSLTGNPNSSNNNVRDTGKQISRIKARKISVNQSGNSGKINQRTKNSRSRDKNLSNNADSHKNSLKNNNKTKYVQPYYQEQSHVSDVNFDADLNQVHLLSQSNSSFKDMQQNRISKTKTGNIKQFQPLDSKISGFSQNSNNKNNKNDGNRNSRNNNNRYFDENKVNIPPIKRLDTLDSAVKNMFDDNKKYKKFGNSLQAQDGRSVAMKDSFGFDKIKKQDNAERDILGFSVLPNQINHGLGSNPSSVTPPPLLKHANTFDKMEQISLIQHKQSTKSCPDIKTVNSKESKSWLSLNLQIIILAAVSVIAAGCIIAYQVLK